MSARLPDCFFPAPLEVPVPQPSHGQDPSFPTPEGIVSSHREFQGEGMDWVSSDSWTPFPSAQGELPVFKDASELAPGLRRLLQPMWGVLRRLGVGLGFHSIFPPDRTLIRLVNFVYDKYPNSRPLFSPPLAQRCGFESLYAVSDPQETSSPRFRLYPRVEKLLDKTSERAATLTKRLKPLSAVLPKKRRLHNVEDALDFATLLTLKPDFSRLAENKSISTKRMSSVTFSELERLEGCSKALLESNSYSLLSG